MADPPRFNTGLSYLHLSAWAEHRQSGGTILGIEVHPAVERAVASIREDPTLDLEAIARRAGLSASRLGYLFQKQNKPDSPWWTSAIVKGRNDAASIMGMENGAPCKKRDLEATRNFTESIAAVT